MKKGHNKARVTKKTGSSKASSQPTSSGRRTAKRRRSPELATANIADIVDRHKNAVVNIEVFKKEKQTSRRPVRDPWEAQSVPTEKESKPTMNIGTGFFFDPRGYILTNEHVIHDADEIFVRFYDQNKGVRAQVIGASYEMDLAILKVNPPKRCRTLPMGNSTRLRAGEWVLAIGCPLGLDHSVTVGVISATERPIRIGDREYGSLIQTDCAINRGNSGGPLINLRGEVIGMNTAVSASSQGIGFAIPIDTVKDVMDDLMKGRPLSRKNSGR